jgi:hypothetical protein
MKLPHQASGDSRDAKSCLAFVAGLPLDDPFRTQQLLIDFLAAQLVAPLPPNDYLQILELIRAPLATAQGEVSQQYVAKPLPPTTAEDAAFRRVVAAWQAMAKCYAQVAHSGGGDPRIQSSLALICQRCIRYTGLALAEHYRAHRVLASGLWLDLHGYFDTAEEWGLATVSVPEPLGGPPRSTTCAATYADVLLTDLSNPYGRNPTELAWILSWSRRFAQLAKLVPLAVDRIVSRSFGVDLMSDQGLQPLKKLAHGPSVRLFDTSRLASELPQVCEKLKGGSQPATLGLGETGSASEALRLLVLLYRPWCLGAIPRRFERLATTGELPSCFGFEAIHFQIGGKEFVQPDHVRDFSRADMDSLWTFRDQLDPAQPLHQRVTHLGYLPEQWDILDASINGFGLYRLLRSATSSRMEYGQLCCVKPAGSEFFLLGRISWLLLRGDGSLRAGMHLFPGKPKAAGIRAMGSDVSVSERYTRALLLPAVSGLHEPETIIVPKGWFRSARGAELLLEDRRQPIRMDQCLDVGADFERIGYTLL